MAWQKSPPELIERFHTLVPDLPGVERRQMFGYPAAFVNGHLFMSLFQEHMVLRLAPADGAALIAMPGGAPFEPMAGRRMTGYALVPPPVLADTAAVTDWIGRAYSFVSAKPPKEKKPRKAKKKA